MIVLLLAFLASATVIDVSQTQQVLDVGFGTSLCWFANGLGGWSNTTAYESVLDLLFANASSQDPVTVGLGLNFVRYNIGGGENPEHLNFLRPGGFVEGYQSADGTYDWTADATQRRVLRSALARGVQHAHAFSNSPPYFMTNSGSVTGASDGGNNLQDDMYDAFAAYLAQVVSHFQTSDYGNIVFDTVTPLNEPVSNWWKFGGDQEGCHFDRDKQALIVQKLAAALTALGVNHTRAHAPEENSIDDALTSLQSYGRATVDQLGLITTHTYNGANRKQLAAFAAAAGQRLWNSEFGTGSGPLQGGLQLAQQIILDLRQLQVPAWTLWQAADLDNTLSPAGWGLLALTFQESPAQQLVLGDPSAGTLCLADTTGTMADGDVVGTVPCASSSPLQGWVLQGDAVKLDNSSGLALDNWNGAMQPGDPVKLYSFWYGPNQMWYYVNNTLRLNNISGLCLTATSPDTPAAVTVEPCTGALTQRWYTRGFPSVRRGNGLQAYRACADGEVASRWAYCANRETPPRGVRTAAEPDAFAIRKQFYAFRQFTAFVRPGSQILNISDPSNSVLAAVSADKQTLVLVVVNGGNSPATFDLTVAAGWSGAVGEAFQTDGDAQNCDTVAWPPTQGNTLSPTVPPTAILTLLVPLN